VTKHMKSGIKKLAGTVEKAFFNCRKKRLFLTVGSKADKACVVQRKKKQQPPPSKKLNPKESTSF
jgi:hypothetical protein